MVILSKFFFAFQKEVKVTACYWPLKTLLKHDSLSITFLHTKNLTTGEVQIKLTDKFLTD